ncbi:hypothetical protein [Evansella clarkii]|uniref:hypothetical protein n=1 Tax=Evansella clarkii TaxID=79879 RepID=UPI000998E409|nr:hypothetical protein [Evansella clarkii]
MTISDITKLESGVEFIEIHNFTTGQLTDFAERQKRFAAQITKNWDNERKAEWITRNYLSLKMILSSTLLLNSAEYAIEKNLMVVEPYLLYYSLLNTSRALLFSDPAMEWNRGKMIRLPHSKVINQTYDLIRIIAPEQGREIKSLLENVRGLRELFSYRFPSNGVKGVFYQSSEVNIDEVISACRLLTELAQFNSEILQLSCEKNCNVKVEISSKDLEIGFIYEDYLTSTNIEKPESIIDEEDWYRLEYFIRKRMEPVNLLWTAREGLVEDFFYSWDLEENNSEGKFDPGRNWGLLLSPL